jgi:hypothetical protein
MPAARGNSSAAVALFLLKHSAGPEHVRLSSSLGVTVGHRPGAGGTVPPAFLCIAAKQSLGGTPCGARSYFTASIRPRFLEFERVQAARGAREPILNLGMRFSNKCGVQLNLRRMARFIALTIFAVKPG